MTPTARLAFAGVLAATLVMSAPAARTATAAPSLAALEREWAAHLLEQRPWEATRAGLRANDGLLVAVTPAWIAADRAWRADFGARLAALPDARLSSRQAALRDSLHRQLEAWHAIEDEQRAWERDPARYGDLAGDAVRGALDRGGACGGAGKAARRLRRVPEVLRSARLNLREVPDSARVEGERRFRAVLALYRVEIPARVADCRDSYALAALAEADTLAVRAVESFLLFLREDLPRTDR